MDIWSNHNFIGGAKITGLPASTAAGEAVTHEQLQAAIEGLSWKDNVRVSTSGNINLAAPGATIDGVAMAIGDRFLVRAQAIPSENGIYVFNGAAIAATRAVDASVLFELHSAMVSVDEGSDAGRVFRQTNIGGVIGTDPVNFVQAFAAAPAATETTQGLAEIATQAETDAGTDDARLITALKLKSSPFARKTYEVLPFGDGTATQYDITHNLGTTNVVAMFRRNSDQSHVDIDWRALNVNTVRVNSVSAVAINELIGTIVA